MIRLTVVVRRHRDLSPEAFRDRWRAHGALIANEPTLARHLVRYEQHDRSSSSLFDGVPGCDGDGVATQWYRSEADLQAFLAEPAYRALIVPDEATLLDRSALTVMLTEEPVVVIGDTNATSRPPADEENDR